MMCTTALLAGCMANTQDPTTDIQQQVDELYGKMSQEERIAQLRSMYMDELLDEQGLLDTAKCRQLIPNGIGHFSQYASQKPVDPNVLRDRVAAVQDWLINNYEWRKMQFEFKFWKFNFGKWEYGYKEKLIGIKNRKAPNRGFFYFKYS